MNDDTDPGGHYPGWPDDGRTRPLPWGGLPPGTSGPGISAIPGDPGGPGGHGAPGRSGAVGRRRGREAPIPAAGAGRDEGLRRLSRLTWRTTQLSAIAAAAFAVLFVRSAPAQTASRVPVTPPSGTPSPTAEATTPAPSPTVSHAVTRRPRAHRATAARPAAPAAASTAAAPPSAAPTLAPPSTPPAPAPQPSPVQTISSGTTGGG